MFNKEYINEICQRYVGRKPVSIYPYFVTLGSLENTVVKKSQFFGAASRSPGESPLDNLKRLYFLEVYCIGKNDFNIQAWLLGNVNDVYTVDTWVLTDTKSFIKKTDDVTTIFPLIISSGAISMTDDEGWMILKGYEVVM